MNIIRKWNEYKAERINVKGLNFIK